jgi:hypothetical protein
VPSALGKAPPSQHVAQSTDWSPGAGAGTTITRTLTAHLTGSPNEAADGHSNFALALPASASHFLSQADGTAYCPGSLDLPRRDPAMSNRDICAKASICPASPPGQRQQRVFTRSGDVLFAFSFSFFPWALSPDLRCRPLQTSDSQLPWQRRGGGRWSRSLVSRGSSHPLANRRNRDLRKLHVVPCAAPGMLEKKKIDVSCPFSLGPGKSSVRALPPDVTVTNCARASAASSFSALPPSSRPSDPPPIASRTQTPPLAGEELHLTSTATNPTPVLFLLYPAFSLPAICWILLPGLGRRVAILAMSLPLPRRKP